MTTRGEICHLLGRAGFGAPAEYVDTVARSGYAAAVEQLVSASGRDTTADAVAPPTFDTGGYLGARQGTAEERRAARRQARAERQALVLWWLQRMVVAEQQLHEKVALLWHDHFATSIQKVKLAELMHLQQQTLYQLALGRFDELARAIVADPAMLVWLDGRENKAGAPNENFAREFFELFTLGLPGEHAAHGAGSYDEADVVDAARAFTGWRLQRGSTEAQFVPRLHDSGTKRVLGATGDLDSDDVVDAATTDPACAPHVVAALWSRLARPAPADDAVVEELAATFTEDLDVRALLRRMLLHEAFRDSAGELVKTPVEYLVGTARALGVAILPRHVQMLGQLGQLPFAPPDVAGWPANEGWLSTSSALTRLRLAVDLVADADLGDVADASRGQRPAALARLLSVSRWGEQTTDALEAAPDASTALTVALVAPEYVVH